MVREQVSKKFKSKFRGMLGPDEKYAKSMTILNRTVRWTDSGIEWEADSRQVEIAIEHMGLDANSKSLSVPCSESEETAEEPLDSTRESLFRAVTA